MIERITIKLTNRRPITIVEDNWPLIARAKDWDNTYEFQANRTWRIRVRQHEDGRTVVYGVYDTHYQGECNRVAGYLLETDDEAQITRAIRDVGEHIGCEDCMIDECIADLPAVKLV